MRSRAAVLCDRVAFIVDGRIACIDSPRALKLRHGERVVRVEYRDGDGTSQADFPLERLAEDAVSPAGFAVTMAGREEDQWPVAAHQCSDRRAVTRDGPMDAVIAHPSSGGHGSEPPQGAPGSRSESHIT
jgi:ABC-type multidrug transport system ATPase subunit